ncbi:sigma-70 family RNA polymerase sigma factor [Paenibacillus sp. 32352]|uniref:sigma-70 family RNA polymerase sigma factor n=1 Tax=Paenibacillus sp. 32352 TaxID=1969111 RepID=UPI0009AEFD21|nr:sigma-70 family RNA polymerase sigma factor [Paenibacillus sp. 32352]
MTVHLKSGPVFSNISMIKRALHQSPTKSLSQYEIVRYLANHWNRITFEDAEHLTNLALQAKLSHFEEDTATGLWTIKHREQSGLDDIYRYMVNQYRLFTVTHLSKRIKWKDTGELFGQLVSDIRFSSVQFNGEDYWMLSEWELANDLVHDYMQRNKLSALLLAEIPDLLLNDYNLRWDKTIFAPEIDPRFRMAGEHVLIDLLEERSEGPETEVPTEIKEEVARSSLLICKYLNRVDHADARDIATNILGAKAYHNMFAVYCKAIDEFLETMEGYRQEENGAWRFVGNEKDIPELMTPQSWKYAVYKSSPVVNIVPSEDGTAETDYCSNVSSYTKQTAGTGRTPSKPRRVMRCLSYYERVKGYLRIPCDWDDFFTGENGRLRIVCNRIEYMWSWKREKAGCFFYGGGVMDFYFDHELEAGRELNMHMHSDSRTIEVVIGGINSVFASEQARYLDIGLLVEESRTVNKSFFVLMCEVLASHPSGMHWVRLFEEVNAIRSANRNTISQLLSRNPCFVPVPNRKGYWYLDSSKLSRYFVDETGNQKDIEAEEGTIGTDLKATETTNAIKRRKENRQPARMTDHWETFSKWAFMQKSLRYEKAKAMALSERELAEILVKAYSKLICKMAANRGTYSVERMDLVQEGYQGLERALKLYSVEEGVPFGHYAKTHILSRMLRKHLDGRTLVRFPIHLWEQIRGFEEEEHKELQQAGTASDFPKKDRKSQQMKIFARWKNVDYISFEQYWAFLSESRADEYEPSWLHLEWLDEQTLKSYHSDPDLTDDQLLEQLETICDIDEEDCELFWAPTTVECSVFRKDLKARLGRILMLLNVKERYVVEKRFGLNNQPEQTLEEISIQLSCTREWVRQIEKKALEKLLGHARKNRLHEYLFPDSV